MPSAAVTATQLLLKQPTICSGAHPQQSFGGFWIAGRLRSKTDAARRWCPWLAAYSGARMGEITQLRGFDIVEQDGVHAMKISPEAGTTKTGKARTVPLHEHLIKQGFLAFVKTNGKGPLFYNEPSQPASSDDPTNPRKPRYVKAREHVAAWVRGLGVNDPELSPNHAWRHTFKALGFRCGIPEKILDAIVGHAPASVGRGYGVPTLVDKARELRKFRRYKCALAKSVALPKAFFFPVRIVSTRLPIL
jgi:integrase